MLILNIFILILSFMVMEFVAWFTHKYVMHGIMWHFHRDHHLKDHESFFERNDVFFLIFAIPGMLFIYFGHQNGLIDPRIWIGSGITLYGLTYLLVHDIFIHQRFRIFTRTESTYLRALRKAHKVHHKHLGKEDGECFGMLWATKKYLEEARQTKLKYDGR